MNSKNIILVVDNRLEVPIIDSPCSSNRSPFKGSGFKATEIDSLDYLERKLSFDKESSILNQLEEKVAILEERVQFLTKNQQFLRKKRRNRRKANQIEKEYKCPMDKCGKFYGSETSLKNHFKIKHINQTFPLNPQSQ